MVLDMDKITNVNLTLENCIQIIIDKKYIKAIEVIFDENKDDLYDSDRKASFIRIDFTPDANICLDGCEFFYGMTITEHEYLLDQLLTRSVVYIDICSDMESTSYNVILTNMDSNEHQRTLLFKDNSFSMVIDEGDNLKDMKIEQVGLFDMVID